MFVRTLDDVIAAGRLRELQAGDTRSARYLSAAVRIVHPTHMLFYFQVGGYESARAVRSMELWAERVVPMVEQALGTLIGEIEGAPP